jgi:hypothetical protein
MSASVLDSIAWIVVAYAVLVAVAGAIGAWLRAPRPRWLDQMAWMLEVLAGVLAAAGIGWVARGHRPDSPSTFYGYLAAAVVVVPVTLQSLREERGPWSSAAVAVASLAIGVVAWRITVVK